MTVKKKTIRNLNAYELEGFDGGGIAGLDVVGRKDSIAQDLSI